MTVFCEGVRTEPAYIRQFANEHANRLVDVKIGDVSGTPMTLVDAAATYRKKTLRKRTDSFERNDQVWVACDCDEHPELARAFDKARANKIAVAYSNPCFELWACLHFHDHDRPLSRGDMQKCLEMVMPKYKKDSNKALDYALMKSGYFAADQRAERMASRRKEEGSPQGNPYTGFYLLMRVIHLNGKLR